MCETCVPSTQYSVLRPVPSTQYLELRALFSAQGIRYLSGVDVAIEFGLFGSILQQMANHLTHR